jgi:predicted lipoprotein with Yx(FWY)xxD motif
MHRPLVPWILVSLLVFGLICGCAGSSHPAHLHAVASQHKDEVESQLPIVLQVSNAAIGPMLTDYFGRTLYIRTSDVPYAGESSLGLDLISRWPVFSTDAPLYSLTPGELGTVVPDPGVQQQLRDEAANGHTGLDFNYTTRALQITYNGWPLYYFVGDLEPGDVNGQNLNDFQVAKP